MASWYSNLLTKTSSQISSLRSTFAGETDGDTEDDTHVCRVLRGYYTEKGRPFPPWLPPDPKAPAQQQPVLVQQPQVGTRYGGGLGQQQQQPPGLSSLWDSNGPSQQPPPQPQSLRAGGRPVPSALQPGGGNVQPRPLPSQRAGSHQSANSFSRPETASVPPGGAGAGAGAGGGSAQDRLRQRLWGSRTTSPAQGSQGPFQPPGGGGGGAAPASGGGGGGSYEDRFAPGGMYDAGSGSGGGGGGRQGLPSGPRRQGLPSGPRAYR